MYYSDHYGIKCDIQQTCILNPKEDKLKIKHIISYEFSILRKRKGNNVTYYILLLKDHSIACKSQGNAISTYLPTDFF